MQDECTQYRAWKEEKEELEKLLADKRQTHVGLCDDIRKTESEIRKMQNASVSMKLAYSPLLDRVDESVDFK